MIKSLKLNADYEMELFSGKNGTPLINQSLEFLLFFLEKRSIYTTKKYSPDFLDYIEEITHNRPRLTSVGECENYWGALTQPEIERWWNSKMTSTQFLIDRGWSPKTKIVRSEKDLLDLDPQETYLLKDPFGMSGQRFVVVGPHLSQSERELNLRGFLRRGEFIAEPFLQRVFDFSHYIFPSGQIIYYQNFIDKKFQYRGTYLADWKTPTVETLSFYNSIAKEVWDESKSHWEDIHTYFNQHPNELGYSLDSFVFEENGVKKIRLMTEVNYRRTMGRVAFELSEKFARHHNWSCTLLCKPTTSGRAVWQILKESSSIWGSDANVWGLSPGDTRFDMIFISASKSLAPDKMFLELKKLLPSSEFAIEI